MKGGKTRYKIDKKNYGYLLTFGGMIDLDEMSKWVEDSKKALVGGPGSFGVVVDMRDLKPLAADTKKKMEEGQKLYKEKALRYKKSLRYIDLLVEREDGDFIIIDYKSSAAFSEHHVTQVRNYVKAIEEISNKRAQGFLCYLLSDEIRLVEV